MKKLRNTSKKSVFMNEQCQSLFFDVTQQKTSIFAIISESAVSKKEFPLPVLEL